MVLQEALELGRDLRALDAAEDALGEAGGLDDLETLQDRGLRGHELEQEALRLLDVAQPAVLPRALHALVDLVPVHAPADSRTQALYSAGWARRARRRAARSCLFFRFYNM